MPISTHSVKNWVAKLMDECAVQKVVEVVEARDAVKGQVETAIAVVARFLEQKFVEKTGKKHLAIFQVRKTSKILRRQGLIKKISLISYVRIFYYS